MTLSDIPISYKYIDMHYLNVILKLYCFYYTYTRFVLTTRFSSNPRKALSLRPQKHCRYQISCLGD